MTSIGVQYSPTTPQRPPLTIKDLQLRGIAYIRVQWVDLTNLIRFRVLPIAYFKKLLETQRPAISVAKVALGLVGLSVVEGFGSNGEYSYVFDLASLKICPYAPRHASVMGFFQEKTPSPGVDHRFEVGLCPRRLLSKVVNDVFKASSVKFLVGFETEFILVNPAGESGPAINHAWSASSATYTGSVESVVLEEIADALQVSGVELQMYHAEGAPKQYEVVTGPLHPLQAADALIHTRETIYNFANKHGLRATLVPRLHNNSAGSGTHLHFSVHSTKHDSETQITTDGIQLRASEASFLAGLLDHLPSVTLLTLPTPASYSRMEDGIWSGGTYVCWGVEHRETPLRVCNPGSPATRNFELKMMDGTSNPYLALAGILGAGSEGLRSGQALKLKPLQGASSASQLSDLERESYGISRRLPRNLQEARGLFQSNEVLRKALGEEFVESYLRVNAALRDYLDSQTNGVFVGMY